MKTDPEALGPSDGWMAAVSAEEAPPEAPPRPQAAPTSTAEDSYRSATVLARNTMLNLVGQGAPLLVALVAIPLLDAGLGTARYGLLLIAWMFLGYFSLFDLGLSRALTQLLADKLGRNLEAEVPPLAWTALALTLVLGLLGGGLLALLTPRVVHVVIAGTSPGLYDDGLRTFYALAASVPVVISTASLRGILAARQRFDLINAIRIPMGIFTFAGPLLVLPFSRTLFAVVLALIAGRLVAWLAHLYFCLRVVPAMRRTVTFRRDLARPLLRFGGWMTVSNVISPLMVYMDRFLIGALLSATAVAYYATPWEVVTKLSLVPAAFVSVLFPAFGFWQHRDAHQMSRLYYAGIKCTALVLFPLALLAVVLAEPALLLWMGQDYAANGARLMQLLAIGVLLQGVASIPFALLQGVGRPDLTAKLHLIELPLYVLVLLGLIHLYGLLGVALAWLLRVALDFVLLMTVSRSFVAGPSTEYRKGIGSMLAAGAVMGVAMVAAQGPLGFPFLAFALTAYTLLVWKYLLSEEEKHFLQRRLRPALWASRIDP